MLNLWKPLKALSAGETPPDRGGGGAVGAQDARALGMEGCWSQWKEIQLNSLS